jgi:hypothetical protein
MPFVRWVAGVETETPKFSEQPLSRLSSAETFVLTKAQS